MPRINLIGASNRQTNQTCHYGSLPGLAPTTHVRTNVTGLAGYKVMSVAANQFKEGRAGYWGLTLSTNTSAMQSGCGLGKYKGACADGTACLKYLNLYKGSNSLGTFSTGRSKLLG